MDTWWMCEVPYRTCRKPCSTPRLGARQPATLVRSAGRRDLFDE